MIDRGGPKSAHPDERFTPVPESTQPVGSALPDFRLPTLGHDTVSLDDALAGRSGAAIVFWSGVCSHCMRYDRYLNAFADRYPSLALLAIAARQDETAEQLRLDVDSRRLGFPILFDGNQQVARAWWVQQTPRAFLVDDHRRLRYRGAIDNFKYPQDPAHRPYLDEAIEDFLAGRPLRRPETQSFGCPVESIYYTLPKPFGA